MKRKVLLAVLPLLAAGVHAQEITDPQTWASTKSASFSHKPNLSTPQFHDNTLISGVAMKLVDAIIKGHHRGRRDKSRAWVFP